jgi:hypothetical protein
MLKVRATELSQSITELALAAAGTDAMAFQPEHTSVGGSVDWPFTNTLKSVRRIRIRGSALSLNVQARSRRINEIWHNIISKSVLGL